MGVRVLIAAGGTGGHVFPALAVAHALRAQGVAVRWLGTRRGLEAELVAAAGFDLSYIDVAGLRGNGLLGWLAAPLRVSRAVAQALGVVRGFRPQVVLGMGGFVSGPGGVAARLRRLPLVIHEQNAIAGLTNRLLATVASRVLQAFPATFGRGETVGNPVRAEIAALAPPDARLAGRDRQLRLLVVGGSLGAKALNEAVPKALARLPQEQRPAVLHQTGRANLEQARHAYAAAQVQAQVEPFLSDMAGAYAWSDLVLCRSGALTVAELAAAGAPALLVPFPYAVDDHQSANARYLSEAGAALLLPQGELSVERLAGLLGEFTDDAATGRQRLLGMARAARAKGQPEATARVVAACLAAAGGQQCTN